MKTRVLFSLKSMVITALFLMLTTSMAWAQVNYIDLNGVTQTCNSYTSITEGNVPQILSDEWYVVNGESSNNGTITYNGTKNRK